MLHVFLARIALAWARGWRAVGVKSQSHRWHARSPLDRRRLSSYWAPCLHIAAAPKLSLISNPIMCQEQEDGCTEEPLPPPGLKGYWQQSYRHATGEPRRREGPHRRETERSNLWG